jgi:hypothetical protein
MGNAVETSVRRNVSTLWPAAHTNVITTPDITLLAHQEEAFRFLGLKRQ